MDKPWQLIVNAFEEIQLLGGHVHLLGVYSVNVVEEVTKMTQVKIRISQDETLLATFHKEIKHSTINGTQRFLSP